MAKSRTPSSQSLLGRRSTWEWASLALILCLAAALRLWRLDSVPPGLTHDEAGHGQDAAAIGHGARPVYETVGYGREPLYDYAVAIAMAVRGRADYLALRETSAVFGLLTVVVTYLWVRRAFGPGEALLACGWLAGSFWAVSVSRQALRSVMLPALLAAAVYAWWRGAFDPHDRPPLNWAWFALSGLFVGATLWTYMAARATWALFLALPLFLLATDRERLKRRWPGMLLTLAVAGVLAAPMFIWLRQHPGAEQRFDQLGQPLRLLAAGDARQVWANSVQALGMFTLRADDLWMYNLPGRPWLGPLEGVLFYAGVVLACLRWRRPRCALALMWLLVGVLPSLVTGVSASTTRAVAALPVVYLFPALAVTAGARWIRSRRPSCPPDPRAPRSAVRARSTMAPSEIRRVSLGIGHWPLVILSVSLILLAGARTYRDYFDVWASARDVRVAYHTTLFEIARDLDQWTVPRDTVVVQSSIYPGRYHDPYALDLMLSRHDLSLRWVDGRGALVFPKVPSRLIVQSLAPLDPALEQAIAPPHARLIESRRLCPDDVNPGFDVYDWDSASALQALLARAARRPVAWSDSTVFPADDPRSVYRALDVPADLGHTIALVGYDLASPVAASGGEVALVTYWRVLSLPSLEVDTVLFTHLLNPGGDPPVIAQQDRLDAPAWNWHPGEVFAQVHRLAVGHDVAAGLYPLEVGAYIRPAPSPMDPNPPTTRLELFVHGQPVSDRILLPPLRVESRVDQ